jgi:hypothetical protein
VALRERELGFVDDGYLQIAKDALAARPCDAGTPPCRPASQILDIRRNVDAAMLVEKVSMLQIQSPTASAIRRRLRCRIRLLILQKAASRSARTPPDGVTGSGPLR